jgi:hypothetical protein
MYIRCIEADGWVARNILIHNPSFTHFPLFPLSPLTVGDPFIINLIIPPHKPQPQPSFPQSPTSAHPHTSTATNAPHNTSSNPSLFPRLFRPYMVQDKSLLYIPVPIPFSQHCCICERLIDRFAYVNGKGSNRLRELLRLDLLFKRVWERGRGRSMGWGRGRGLRFSWPEISMVVLGEKDGLAVVCFFLWMCLLKLG